MTNGCCPQLFKSMRRLDDMLKVPDVLLASKIISQSQAICDPSQEMRHIARYLNPRSCVAIQLTGAHPYPAGPTILETMRSIGTGFVALSLIMLSRGIQGLSR
jgi:hypothetical protein